MPEEVKTYKTLYGYINPFDQFVSLQARTGLTGKATDALLGSYMLTMEGWMNDEKLLDVVINVAEDSYEITSPLIMTWHMVSYQHLTYEVWVIPEHEDTWEYIERSPSRDNALDIPFNDVPFFPVDGNIPTTLPSNGRFGITGSARSAIIQDMIVPIRYQ